MLRVVLDHPHAFLGRRVWRRFTSLVGGLLLVVGLTASVPALPATFAVASLGMAWATADDADPEPIPADLPVRDIVLTFAISAPLAIFGTRNGLRLLRRNRTLILFLRRFGYDDAQSAVTYAVTQTIGSSWRVVTLDDAEMVAIGVEDGTRRVFTAGQFVSKWVLGTGMFLGLRAFPYLISTLWGIIALALAGPALEFAQSGVPHWDKWADAVDPYLRIVAMIFDRHAPLQYIGPTLPGVFAIVAMMAAASFMVMIASMVVLLIAVPMMPVIAFLSSSAESIQDAEKSKTVSVTSLQDIHAAAAAIAARSHKVFGPRLVVIKVASRVWREAVSELARLSTVPLIDISEPTGNLLWELQELTQRFGDRCVIIGRHERISGAVDATLAALVGDREVLAYTTDRQGLRRFARALRGTLLSRQ